MAAKTKPRRSSTSSPSAAQRLGEFGRFCAELRIEDGVTPFELQPFQRQILTPYFDGATETAILLPSGNGKSTMCAALALYHLVVTPNADCIMVAAAREQAEIILRQSRMFIRSNTSLQRLVTMQQRTILSKVDDGRIRVLAADADTADGTIPTLVIVDELHRHRTGELYEVLRDKLGKRGGQLITISTAGANLASPLGQIRTKAHALPGFKRTGKHNHVRSADGRFAFHEWCLDRGDDPDDMATVKKANPGPMHTIEKLRMRHDTPSMTPYTWLRFACGIWTEGAEPWVNPARWDALAGEPRLEGDRAMGVRVAAGHASAAIVLVTKSDGKVQVEQHLMRLGDGLPPLVQVEERVRELWAEHRPTVMVYTGDTFRRSADMLEAEGITVLETPYTPRRMQPIAEGLLALIEAGELVHDGSEDFRAQVMAARVRQTERGWSFIESPEATAPIDGLLAMAIAVDALSLAEVPQEVFFAFS